MLTKIKIDRFRILRIGETAPEFAGKTLDDRDIKLSDLRGKVVFVDFWATWCGPCVKEFPHVRAVHEEFGKDGEFVVLGISLDEDAKKVRKFIKKKDADWTHIVAGPLGKNPIAEKYFVEGVPATYLIDRNGKIAAKDLRGKDLRKEVHKLMKKKQVAEKEEPQSPPPLDEV